MLKRYYIMAWDYRVGPYAKHLSGVSISIWNIYIVPILPWKPEFALKVWENLKTNQNVILQHLPHFVMEP